MSNERTDSRSDLELQGVLWSTFLELEVRGVPADLRGVDLSKANLSGASLEGANLRGALLAGANIWEANLDGAVMEGAEGADAPE